MCSSQNNCSLGAILNYIYRYNVMYYGIELNFLKRYFYNNNESYIYIL